MKTISAGASTSELAHDPGGVSRAWRITPRVADCLGDSVRNESADHKDHTAHSGNELPAAPGRARIGINGLPGQGPVLERYPQAARNHAHAKDLE